MSEDAQQTSKSFLTRAFIQESKQRLLQEKANILKRLASEYKEFQELVAQKDPKDSIDVTVDAVDRRTLESLEIREASLLEAINNALIRLHQGHYGLCLQCGKIIQKQRLIALPEAILCIHCKSTREQRSQVIAPV